MHIKHTVTFSTLKSEDQIRYRYRYIFNTILMVQSDKKNICLGFIIFSLFIHTHIHTYMHIYVRFKS